MAPSFGEIAVSSWSWTAKFCVLELAKNLSGCGRQAEVVEPHRRYDPQRSPLGDVLEIDRRLRRSRCRGSSCWGTSRRRRSSWITPVASVTCERSRKRSVSVKSTVRAVGEEVLRPPEPARRGGLDLGADDLLIVEQVGEALLRRAGRRRTAEVGGPQLVGEFLAMHRRSVDLGLDLVGQHEVDRRVPLAADAPAIGRILAVAVEDAWRTGRGRRRSRS